MMRLFNEQSVEDIADEVREQRGVTDTYTIAELKSAVHNAIQKYKQNNPTNTVNNGVLTNSYDVPILNYKLYGNSTQESTTGKNILNNNEGTNIKQGVTFTNLGKGEFNLNGTLLNPIDGYIGRNLNAILKENTTYTLLFEVFGGDIQNIANITNISLNGTRDGVGVFNMHYMNVKTAISSTIIKSTFTTIGQEIIQACNLYVDSSGVIFNNYKIRVMVYEGTDDIPYEPYTGGQPSPSPDYPSEIKSVGDLVTEGEHQGKYKVPIRVSGANLAYDGWAQDFVDRIKNKNATQIEDFQNRHCLMFWAYAGYQEYDTKYLFKTTWKENTQYTFKFDLLPSKASSNLSIAYTDGSSQYIGSGLTPNTWVSKIITSEANKTIKYLRANYNDGQCYIDLDTFMIYEGTEDKPYEPYHEPIIKNIYLDRPLYKVGDVADYIDFSTGKRHNLIGEIVFDGSNNQHWSGAGGNDDFFRFYCDNVPNVRYASYVSRCKSNYFQRKDYIAMDSTFEGISSSTFGGYIYLMILRSRLTDVSVSSLQNWLSTHNTEVIYELATPTEENIELPPLNAYNGTTIIELDTEVQPSKIEANYITKAGV